MKSLVTFIKDKYNSAGRSVYTFFTAPSNANIQLMLFVAGVSLLTLGIVKGVIAQDYTDYDSITVDEGVDTTRLNMAVRKIFAYLEGSLGVLVMVVSGLGAILSSAFGQYRAALGCLVVAIGAFILRSVASTFFNTSDIFNE